MDGSRSGGIPIVNDAFMDEGGRRLRRVLCAIGTRPEAIKMAPVIAALRRTDWADCRVMLTGQHRDLVDPILLGFGIEADIDLNLMRPGQTLNDLAGRLLMAVGRVLSSTPADFVLAQGDTTTVLATALACFHQRIPFGHIEAGLRSGIPSAPFPEEMNRVVAARMASLHFAPTVSARDNLVREGIDPTTIHVTGNTVIDALLETARRVSGHAWKTSGRRLVLVTAHRRDSFGEPIRRVCAALATLLGRHPDIELLWPVHPNPSIRPVVHELLGGLPRARLVEPLGYEAFVAAMLQADLVLTDSGGVQEEAPALGRPVLVLRSESERPEAITAGVARLVGTCPETIAREASRLLADPAAYHSMARRTSPYGDGRAAERIVAALAARLDVASLSPPPLHHSRAPIHAS